MNMDTMFLVFVFGSIAYIGIFFGKLLWDIHQDATKRTTEVRK